MWWFLWIGFAWGASPEVLPRVEQPIRVRTYDKLTTSNPPRAYRRSRKGRYSVWMWPDGTIEHLEERRARELVKVQRFHASGSPITTIHYENGAPQQATVHGVHPQDIPLDGWVTWTLGDTELLLPATPNDRNELLLSNARMSFVLDDAVNVMDGTVEQALLSNCACLLEDRVPVWVNGRVGVRFRLSYPHPHTPRISEVWAIPVGDLKTLYIAAIAEEVTTGPGALSIGRTVISLLR